MNRQTCNGEVKWQKISVLVHEKQIIVLQIYKYFLILKYEV